MKRLSENLKRILNALALQDAGEFLSTNSKLDMLGVGTGNPDATTAESRRAAPPRRRVALLSDGENIEGILQYALEACQRQKATLDLVLHGIGKQMSEKLRDQIMAHDVVHEMILLGEESVSALVEYLNLRRSLFYVIAPADDRLALELTQRVAPAPGGLMYLPIVLVDRKQQKQVTQARQVTQRNKLNAQ